MQNPNWHQAPNGRPECEWKRGERREISRPEEAGSHQRRSPKLEAPPLSLPIRGYPNDPRCQGFAAPRKRPRALDSEDRSEGVSLIGRERGSVAKREASAGAERRENPLSFAEN